MAGRPVQRSRQFEVSSPLGVDELLFRHLHAQERISGLFEFELQVLSTRENLSAADILAQRVSVRMNIDNKGTQRHFDGFVSRFAQDDAWEEYFSYRLTLRPWLWFLTRTANCRIFQEQTVPEIIQQVFQDHGFSDFELRLSGDYAQREYCVQYRETDFNFLSRLMEHEGIYYFFQHEAGKHVLVLADHYGAHASAPDYDSVPYFPPDSHDRRERDHIFAWSREQVVQPGAYVLRDYDFKKPRKNLEVDASDPKDHASADYEFFDYPGFYRDGAVGDGYAAVRLEELSARHERVLGEGNARGLGVGNLFTLSDYPRDIENREYLLVETHIDLRSDQYRSGSDEGPDFKCSFSALQSEIPYRPARSTPRPFVQGPQTAVVTGPQGEEIWTDEHGRVKVQFFWDRYGKKNENSSCWMRVSQPWAGQNWGAVAIPRVDQEVIVDFLEGDPDRPIVTGRVYNGQQKPPYPLPDQAMVSGVKSNSTPGGDGYNEISMDDTAGSERITIHAQYDMDTTVEHDKTTEVENDRSTVVHTGDDSLQLETGNRTVTLDQGNHATKVSMGKMNKEAMQSIELKVGSNSIKIDQSGITIKGLMVKIEATTMLEAKSVMTAIKGEAMVTLKGGITLIN